ncbi:MAG: bifunctional phosphoribosylaminoimidazolecarboxamide formyltransferase/inosine monophosphate cyclohydrolase [Thermoplasmata archaeon]|nr:MAG: bifunctional phosphoribosylaminoimidazolecarboxamide formyltransferase/inosine monophosphate cyclohydrolase [Thermoplasmata archaeon]
MSIERALISVADKEGIVGFARELESLGVEILATGGTARFLQNNGIETKEISEITGFPEIMGGRVKTLHPKIFGGILASTNEHVDEMHAHGIPKIDMVVVNLYPFERECEKGEEVALENIDIGGVSLIRAAAKNYRRVLVITNKERYGEVIERIKKGALDIEYRRKLAAEAFWHTCRYDALIYRYFSHMLGENFPSHILIMGDKVEELRYGENPHQSAALYAQAINGMTSWPYKQHQGKQLSFNNILDADDALALISEFEEPAACVVKHTNPCGVAVAEDILRAYDLAYNCDPKSAFGGIVAVNREVDDELAERLVEVFLEVVVAPSYSDEALKVLRRRKNLRVLEYKGDKIHGFDIRNVRGGFLAQTPNHRRLLADELRVVTKRSPTEGELKDLMFAWKVVKHVKSNAIVFAKNGVTVGIGAGQMSRVDAVWIASEKAGDRARDAVMASDAFFPFRDGIDTAARAGISAIIQPGGSIRDREVIDAADEFGMAMVFTGWRAFKH